MDWIPVSERFPETDEYGDSDYVLISFSNFTIPQIGQYRVDGDGSGAFYLGDEEKPLVEYGVFVNAWMPLPEPYREERTEE